MKAQKTHRIYVRLTDEEKKRLRKLAENYHNLSAFILDACNNFDTRVTVNKFDFLSSWLENYSKYKAELNSLSNNINQLAHYSNILRNSGVVNPIVLQEQSKLYNKLVDLLSLINQSNLHLEDTFKEIRKL